MVLPPLLPATNASNDGDDDVDLCGGGGDSNQ